MDEAIDKAVQAKKEKMAISIGVCCNAVDMLERLLERNIIRIHLRTKPLHTILNRIPAAPGFAGSSKILRESNRQIPGAA